MPTPTTPEDPRTQAKIWQVYRDYFDLAEKKRRWNLRDDIPWDQCNPNTSKAIADVLESFCAVELFLPDYVGKFLPLVRGTRGDVSLDTYVAFLTEAYHHVRHTVPLLMACGSRLGRPRSPPAPPGWPSDRTSSSSTTASTCSTRCGSSSRASPRALRISPSCSPRG